jgi:hypothetical protein
MTDNDVLISSRVRDLEHQVSELKGTVEQLNRSITAGNRMTAWQFIGFVFVMSGTLFGALYWATGVLERRIDQSEKNLLLQIEKSEQNMNKRFDDLRQIVLVQQKQVPPQR